jgi:toxin ParE1/3/4
MSWKVVVRPEAEQDIVEAAAWYEACQAGLGAEFVQEVIQVWDALAENPLLNSRRHPNKDIRWRYPERFPHRIIYEIIEADKTVVVAAVLHAARHDRLWQQRMT